MEVIPDWLTPTGYNGAPGPAPFATNAFGELGAFTAPAQAAPAPAPTTPPAGTAGSNPWPPGSSQAALWDLHQAGATAADQGALVDLGTAAAAPAATSTIPPATSASDIASILGPNMPASIAQDALSWANQELLDPNMTVEQMQNDLYTKQPAWFKTAFPGIIQQLKTGQTPMSPGDYLTFKQNVYDFNKQFGIPDGFVTDADIGDMIGRGWTFQQDYVGRMNLAFSSTADALANNPEATGLLDKWYGIKPGSGALAAFFLDPNRAQPLLAQAATAAQAGASAATAGYLPISQSDLMALAANHSLSELQSGINAGIPILPTQHQSLTGIEALTPTDIIASQVGGMPGGESGEAAQGKVNRVVGERTAAFHGGGGEVGQGAAGALGVGFGTQ